MKFLIKHTVDSMNDRCRMMWTTPWFSSLKNLHYSGSSIVLHFLFFAKRIKLFLHTALGLAQWDEILFGFAFIKYASNKTSEKLIFILLNQFVYLFIAWKCNWIKMKVRIKEIFYPVVIGHANYKTRRCEYHFNWNSR